MQTDLGEIELVLYPKRAAPTVDAFCALVDDGSFARQGCFYRAVRKDENDHGHPKIDVIQGGLPDELAPKRNVQHVSTLRSGLRHLDGTISLARDVGSPDSATGAAFFICIGDQPCLDAHGLRAIDGAGFAVFGRVRQGMPVVRAIHRLPTRCDAVDGYCAGQMLDPPILIRRVFRCVS